MFSLWLRPVIYQPYTALLRKCFDSYYRSNTIVLDTEIPLVYHHAIIHISDLYFHMADTACHNIIFKYALISGILVTDLKRISM